jgi:C-terminal processing protease CtpA/Prc
MKIKMTVVLGLLVVALTVLAGGWQVGGIGIATTRKSDNEQWRIDLVFPGSPAEVAGIKTNWFLISVDGTKVVSMSSCMSVVAGPIGTFVTLELADPTMSRTNKVTVKRADVKLPDGLFDGLRPDGSHSTNASPHVILISQ